MAFFSNLKTIMVLGDHGVIVLLCSVEKDTRRCCHDILEHLGLPPKKRGSVSIFSTEITTYSQGLFKSVPAVWHVQHVICFRRLLHEKHFPPVRTTPLSCG